jgi:hypothetical protein
MDIFYLGDEVFVERASMLEVDRIDLHLIFKKDEEEESVESYSFLSVCPSDGLRSARRCAS